MGIHGIWIQHPLIEFRHCDWFIDFNDFAAAEKSGGAALLASDIVIPLGAVMYMTIMPQRKQRQKQADMIRKLEVGDEVLTSGGIVGKITFIERITCTTWKSTTTL